MKITKWLLLLGLIPCLCFASDKKDERKLRKKQREAKNTLTKEDVSTVTKLPHPQNNPPVKANQKFQFERSEILEKAKQLDVLISKNLNKEGITFNPKAEESLLARRVYLDIVGRIPTPNEIDAFTKMTEDNNISKLIDQLLLDKGHHSHQFNWFADMLRHKSGIKRFNFNSYERWIKNQIKTNRPWNELVFDLLTSEGTLATDPKVGYLVRDRGMPLDSLSNTLTLFLGANVACAQCHDHPLADWTQREFYEMAAFFGSTSVGNLDPRKISKKISNEVGQGQVSKQDMIALVAPNWGNVFTKPSQDLVYPDDYAYDDVKPGSPVSPYYIAWDRKGEFAKLHQGKIGTPEELRQQFATWMTDPNNPRFAISIANRLWKKMFGIAIQEPIHDLDDLSYASNPELIVLAGKIMRELNFDLRAFQRVIMHTQAYQASANPTPKMGDADDYLFAGPVLRRMQAAQTYDSALILIGGTSVDNVEIDKSHYVTRFQIKDNDFSAQNLYRTALTMKANGYLNKKSNRGAPSIYTNGQKPAKVGNQELLRTSEMEQPARTSHFLRMFGQSSRDIMDDDSVEGNIPQTLMLMNGKLQSLIKHEDSLIMKKVHQQKQLKSKIQLMYKSFYGRQATQAEVSQISKAIKNGLAIEELSWVLFNTPEFLFIQ